MTNHNFYIQYHNADKLGYFPTENVNFNTLISEIILDDNLKKQYPWIYTSKKKTVEKSIGSICFLIVGKTENKIKNYYLWCYFEIQNYQQKDNDLVDVYGKGRHLKNPIHLNNLSDFDNFKKFCGNFGIGFQNITKHNFYEILNSHTNNK